MKIYTFLGFLFFFTGLAYSSFKEVPSEEMAFNVKNEEGLTPLMIAVEDGDSDEVAQLLEKGANPNIVSDTGLTSLKIAIKNRRPRLRSRGDQLGEEIISLLISNGADIDDEDRKALEKLKLIKKLPPSSPKLYKEDYIKQKAARLKEESTSPYEHSRALRRHHMKYPNYKEVKKFLLDYQEPSEFTGAVEWAHRKGLHGEDTRIVIMEARTDGSNAPATETDLFPLAAKMDSHGIAVLNIVHRVAPAAKIFLLPVPDPTTIYDRKAFSYIKKYTTEAFTKNSIVNSSFEVKYPEYESFQPLQIWRQNTFSELLQNNCLIIQGAGNDGVPLARSKIGEFLKGFFSQNLSHGFLIAGSVNPTYSIADYSNTPGDNPLFQQKFLCTLGTNIPSMATGHPTTLSGTSLSAPAISGVAALVLSAYPTFTMEEVASTLLESAEQNFFIPSSQSGHKGTFIYEDTPPPVKKDGIIFKPFDPTLYGRGILSVRRAFIYADILRRAKEEMPQSTHAQHIEEANSIFRLRIKRLEGEHATKLQDHTRRFLERQKLKHLKEERADQKT